MSADKQPTLGITGGSRGIGLAISELFLERGWRVAVFSRSAPKQEHPSSLLHVKGDVRQRKDLENFIQTIQKTWGHLDAFVNAAGVSVWRKISAMDEAFARELIETNSLGTLWGCQAAAAVMNAGGSIVNVSSLAGKRGSANNSAYCASKFAVNGITQSLAKELGSQGIRVNAVCPVYVQTDHIMASLALKDSPAEGQSVPDYLNTFAQTQTALKRLPTAREVAEAVYFIASPAASAISGQCINVDCGTLPQ